MYCKILAEFIFVVVMILHELFFIAYSLSKYGMSLCVLGMSQEFKDDGIAVNALWPKKGLII